MKLSCAIFAGWRIAARQAVSTSPDAISNADAAMSRLVIAAGLKLIVVPIDSTWMRRSLAIGPRARASHASRARAGRSRARQSKWAGSTRRCTRTALATAPFLFGHDHTTIVSKRPSPLLTAREIDPYARTPSLIDSEHGSALECPRLVHFLRPTSCLFFPSPSARSSRPSAWKRGDT
jgi:hypothetical protein